MEIRALQKNDLDELVSLYHYLDEDDPAIDINRLNNIWTQSENATIVTYWGLFKDRTLASACQLLIVPNITRGGKPYSLIENVVTHPSYRHNGYGKALLKHILAFAWSKGCYKAMLMTSRKDENVHKFYKSAGFNGSAKHAYIAKP